MVVAVAAATLVSPAVAQNTGCDSVVGRAVDCPDVPTDGIRYISGVDLIDVRDAGTQEETTVDTGVEGIHLSTSGGSAPFVDTQVAVEFVVVDYDHDSDTDTDPKEVLATPGTPPVHLMYEGQRVIKTGADAFTADGATVTLEELSELFLLGATEDGGQVTAGLTVNNPGTSGQGSAGFNTNYSFRIVSDRVVTQSNSRLSVDGHEIVVTAPNQYSINGEIFNSDAALFNHLLDLERQDTIKTLVTREFDGQDQVVNSFNVPLLVGVSPIFRTAPYTYSIAGVGTFGSDASLLAYLVAEGVGGYRFALNPERVTGGSITDSTTNANGIYVGSTGGNGGNGSCSSVGLATWCRKGKSGGNAGSIAVNNDGEVTVNGVTKAYGIAAISQGGRGGKGGGGFGLFASDAGGGGRGGHGGDVFVNLGANSRVETFGFGGHAVYARSRGGNGGSAGGSTGLVATGSKGGNGGDAGEVTVANFGTIITNGQRAYGIYAESIGAGAGTGASAGGLVAVGGNGGGESDGDKVTISNQGSIATHGFSSYGIFAQSVGGGGGDGGDTGGLISIGGDGESGGNSNTVRIMNSGSITTKSEGSIGVFAQSIGGGGGNGGGAYAIGVGASLAIGGDGKPGGDGGLVLYNQTEDFFDTPTPGPGVDINALEFATILTGGDRAHGIQVQSVGGGGGNGGFAFSGTAPFAGISASFALGGSGGKGGDGDQVYVNEKGLVSTGGDGSIGIFAQSVGGGGGSGGGAVSAAVGGAFSLSLSVGGSAGDGGSGDNVTVNKVGDILTVGAQSHGILAQSVGGGGGNGGYSVAASAGGLSGAIALGGGGGVGGSAGDVLVNVLNGTGTPTIRTGGEGAIGILAQSVGGGGGNGGIAGTIAGGAGALGVSLGGTGAGGASGGTVGVINRNRMITRGNASHAIFAQSVGGGGGNGGAAFSGTGGVVGISVAVGGAGGAGSDGGIVTVDNYGAITTGYTMLTTVDGETAVDHFGNKAYGIFAQSVGGGGGNGGLAISGAVGVSIKDVPGGAAAISIGGKGGGASDSDLVTVNNHGSIETFGLGSHAVFAQSVGGGGGDGGFAGAVAVTIGGGVAVGVAVGGSASGGGDGDTVAVNTFGSDKSITTHADGADGIHAQSVGGGGGDGGFAFAGAFGFGGQISANVAVAIGGSGGAGGEGGAVNVASRQAITTYGNNANGIMAQSVGGGGGNGGMAVTGTLAFSASSGNVGVSVGGAGGIASFARNVTVDNYGAITTWGVDAIGILAQSIGGSGGNGGLAIAAQFTSSTEKSATIGVSVGGGAGDGNYAGDANVTNRAAGVITTFGMGGHGIKAQSIGGGGGNGGLAVVAQLGSSTGTENQTSKTLNVGVSVGGAGGKGGVGKTVRVTNDGAINVGGPSAIGIFAQSIGGGGGDGGGAITGVGALTDSVNEGSRSVSVAVAVGGNGESGNRGGNVRVTNSGRIETRGTTGYGIFAQSIGGGGGIGGRANTIQMLFSKKPSEPQAKKTSIQLSAAVGGSGGTGGHGGVVFVDNTGEIVTYNELSDGIYAQSVGAGGGVGGSGTLGFGDLLPIPGSGALLTVLGRGAGLSDSTGKFRKMEIAVGGSGGATGDGELVEVRNNKAITTHGTNSNAIFAQSIGGGGGVGGKAVTGLGAAFTNPKIPQAIGLGGEGGAAGDGGVVSVTQYGGALIQTYGVASNGIFAQSVGGGGGVAGNVDRLLSNGIKGVGVPPLNVGSGLSLGRSGGAGGDGGAVTVDLDGTIVTRGTSSSGIFAQSVGGGGGVLGGLGNDFLPINSWQLGSAGDAGDSGLVDVDVDGTILTTGNSAAGIFAQSAAGAAGTAGNVDIAVTGSVLTAVILNEATDGTLADPQRGLGSIGVFGQSVSSTGGTNGDVVIAINGANSFVRGGRTLIHDGVLETPTIRIVKTYTLDTTVVGLPGIEDAGDKMRFTYLVKNTSSQRLYDVTVAEDGDVFTGENGAPTVMYASGGTPSGSGYSLAPGATMAFTSEYIMTLDDIETGYVANQAKVSSRTAANGAGLVISDMTDDGSDEDKGISTDSFVGVGVYVMDGDKNTITNQGTITTFSGVDGGYAILAAGSNEAGSQKGGDEAVSNFGTVTGSFDLAFGENSFVNQQGAVLNSGEFAFVGVGAGNQLTNHGWMSPGGTGRVMTTAIDNTFVQSATGTFGVDLDLDLTSLTSPDPLQPSEADVLLGAQTMDFGGMVDLRLLNASGALPGQHAALIARSETGIVDNGLALTAPSSAVAVYALDFDTAPTDLQLNYGIDFSPDGLNQNQASVGEYINQIQLAGGSDELDPVVAALFGLPDLETYAPVLDQFSLEPYVVQQLSAVYGALDFERSLMSCSVYGGENKFNAQGECFWASVVGNETNYRSDAENEAFTSKSGGMRVGGQRAISDTVFAGFGFSSESFGNGFGANSQRDGHRYQIGGAVKAIYGGTTLAATLSGGYDSFTLTRDITIPNGPSYIVEGNQNTAFVSAHGRVSHTFGQNSFYLKPHLDIGVTAVRAGAVSETGGSPVALNIAATRQEFTTVEAALEVGGEFQMTSKSVFRPFGAVGVLSFPGQSPTTASATFASAPLGAGSFTSYRGAEEDTLDLKLGFDILSEDGWSVRVFALGKVGETSELTDINLKLAMPF